MKHIINFGILLTAGILQFSCFTVKYSTSGASIPVEAKTVSVQFFENQAPIVEPTLALKVTNALKDYIQSNTKLILVNGTGDLDFEGAITGFSESASGISSGDLVVQQKRFTIAIKVRYTNSFDKEKDWESSFSRFQDYGGATSFQQAQASYTEDIVELLVEDIFNKAFVNW
ncbi:MAG: LptE family protein [Bacteroidales bacterium]|nr:LptE family protein [Bacteroidales bacterium]